MAPGRLRCTRESSGSLGPVCASGLRSATGNPDRTADSMRPLRVRQCHASIEMSPAASPPEKPIEALALGRPDGLGDLSALGETVAAEDGSFHDALVSPESAEALADAFQELGEDVDGRAQRALAGRRLAA